jgi:hypothetical protein
VPHTNVLTNSVIASPMVHFAVIFTVLGTMSGLSNQR